MEPAPTACTNRVASIIPANRPIAAVIPKPSRGGIECQRTAIQSTSERRKGHDNCNRNPPTPGTILRCQAIRTMGGRTAGSFSRLRLGGDQRRRRRLLQSIIHGQRPHEKDTCLQDKYQPRLCTRQGSVQNHPALSVGVAAAAGADAIATRNV